MSVRPHASITPLLRRITARPFSTTLPAFNDPVIPPTLTGAAALGFKPRTGRTRQLPADLMLDVPASYRENVSSSRSRRDPSSGRGPAVDTSSNANFFEGSRPRRTPRRDHPDEVVSAPRQREQSHQPAERTASTPPPRRRVESVSNDVVAGDLLPPDAKAYQARQRSRPRPGQNQSQTQVNAGVDRQTQRPRPGQAAGQRQGPGQSQSQSGPVGRRRPGQATGARSGPSSGKPRSKRNGPPGGRRTGGRGGDRERPPPVIKKTVPMAEYTKSLSGTFGPQTLLGERRTLVRSRHAVKVSNSFQNREKTAQVNTPRLPTTPVTPENTAWRAITVAQWAGIVNPTMMRKSMTQLNDTVMRLLDKKKQSS